MNIPRWSPPFRYTAIPNTLFEWLQHLTPAEFTVYACIARKTWGFQKASDTIPISQLVLMSGIPRRTVDQSLARLRDCGLITMTGPSRHPKIIAPTTLRLITGDAITALEKATGDAIPCITVTQPLRTSKEKRKASGLKILRPSRKQDRRLV